MTLTANWSYPTAIRFGAAASPRSARPAPPRDHAPLLVTDRGLAAAMEITGRARST
jgi:hypothetical protein